MVQQHELEALCKKRKRIGRGGSRGGTSGRGHKGQRARSGGRSGLKAFFEGGQMPLSRRLPRRGFVNSFKTMFHLIQLSELEKRFEADATVTRETLHEKGLIKGSKFWPIKILFRGELTKKLTVCADKFSKRAAAAIEKAGGVVEYSKVAPFTVNRSR